MAITEQDRYKMGGQLHPEMVEVSTIDVRIFVQVLTL